ncbi:MAG: hypothetical protein H6765_11265 [Candidatus Peribacteria bacterium]|nr:MAG: hypothetical protein H6765_11265 [Candidatus Peribacteria bacterium]
MLSHFQSLVNPGKSIPPYITHLTGISNQMVASAPTIQEILPDFLAFLGSNIFVAHNAAFDHGFLAGSAEKHLQHTWTNAVLCTRKLANRVVPDLPRK